jgi:hypothetical protein
MDVPVGIVEWEVFVPDNYSVRPIDGNVIDRHTFPGVITAATAAGHGIGSKLPPAIGGGFGGGVYRPTTPVAGQISGRVVDTQGAAIPGATVVLEIGRTRQVVTSGADGSFVYSGVPSGNVTVTAQLPGLVSESRSLVYDRQPQDLELHLAPGGVAETVAVAGDSARIDVSAGRANQRATAPSQNVIDLQRRAAGVLPIRVDVPRAGTSHQFVKPLVVDQEAAVIFRYKRRS